LPDDIFIQFRHDLAGRQSFHGLTRIISEHSM
jgi:hypothetical protein